MLYKFKDIPQDIWGQKIISGFRTTFFYTADMTPEYKLSDLLTIVDKTLKEMFRSFDFWCSAEVISAKLWRGQTLYLELVEYDAEGKIIAKIKAVIYDEWVHRNFLLQTKLASIDDLVGMKILFHGYMNFSPTRSDLSINIKELSSEYTLGHLQKNQNDIIAELTKLGILTHNKSTTRGFPPVRIAVISAAGAAGLKDFYTVIEQSGYQVSYQEYFCAMHGNNAISEVKEQLDLIALALQAGQEINAIAIIRGGGESSGIAWQNDFEIAKAICLMPVPVVVAVGHTQDKTILQEISRYGAKTPTDAAYKIISLCTDWDNELSVLYDAILACSTDQILSLRENVDLWHDQINQRSSQLVHHTRIHIDAWYNTIVATSPKKLIQSGYALLMQWDHYLSKQQIDALEVGDSLDISVYDHHITAQITKKQ